MYQFKMEPSDLMATECCAPPAHATAVNPPPVGVHRTPPGTSHPQQSSEPSDLSANECSLKKTKQAVLKKN